MAIPNDGVDDAAIVGDSANGLSLWYVTGLSGGTHDIVIDHAGSETSTRTNGWLWKVSDISSWVKATAAEDASHQATDTLAVNANVLTDDIVFLVAYSANAVSNDSPDWDNIVGVTPDSTFIGNTTEPGTMRAGFHVCTTDETPRTLSIGDDDEDGNRIIALSLVGRG